MASSRILHIMKLILVIYLITKTNAVDKTVGDYNDDNGDEYYDDNGDEYKEDEDAIVEETKTEIDTKKSQNSHTFVKPIDHIEILKIDNPPDENIKLDTLEVNDLKKSIKKTNKIEKLVDSATIQKSNNAGSKHGLKLYDLTQPSKEWYTCVFSQMEPPAYICIDDIWVDGVISSSLFSRGSWEHHVSTKIISALNEDPLLGFIDIGANFGTHTLTVAASGRRVIAVEPLDFNYQKLHRAARINKFEGYITLVTNAVSNTRDTVTMQKWTRNMGHSHITTDPKKKQTNNTVQVQSILMDDLLDVIPFKDAVLKIDIEGYECEAMEQSKEFFKTLNIPYILMEWPGRWMGNDFKLVLEKCSIPNMIHYLTEMGYKPYRVTTNENLDIDKWKMWSPPNYSSDVDVYWKLQK